MKWIVGFALAYLAVDAFVVTPRSEARPKVARLNLVNSEWPELGPRKQSQTSRRLYGAQAAGRVRSAR